MAGAPLKWGRTTTAALLGFLHLTLLIPGAFALRCHTNSSLGQLSRDQIGPFISEDLGYISNCSSDENVCAEALLMLSTEESTLVVTRRGCASSGLKDETGSSASGNQHLSVHSSVRYCHSDLCNVEPILIDAFKIPTLERASEANSSNRCYSAIDPEPGDDLDKVTCGRDYSQCFEGIAAITFGKGTAYIQIKSCQDLSCKVPESWFSSPIDLKLSGSCCHGTLCNGMMVAAQAQIQTNSTTAPAQDATRPGEEDASTRPTDFPKHNTTDDTHDTFAVTEEVTDTTIPGHKSDINIGTTTLHNPLYDYEENEDDIELPVSTNNTLNPRAANLGPSTPSLPFYLLLGVLGIVSLKIW